MKVLKFSFVLAITVSGVAAIAAENVKAVKRMPASKAKVVACYSNMNLAAISYELNPKNDGSEEACDTTKPFSIAPNLEKSAEAPYILCCNLKKLTDSK